MRILHFLSGINFKVFIKVFLIDVELILVLFCPISSHCILLLNENNFKFVIEDIRL